MNIDITEELKFNEQESKLDFTLYFIRNYVVYLQHKWNLEFELEHLNITLRDLLQTQARQGRTYSSTQGYGPHQSYNQQYDHFERTGRTYNVIEFYDQLEFAKQQVAKLGFSVWYLDVIKPLHIQTSKLIEKKRHLDAEISEINREIEEFEKQEEVSEEHRQQEHINKAVRLKQELQKKVVIDQATDEQIDYIKMRYKNLKVIGKEHFRLIAPEFFKFINNP